MMRRGTCNVKLAAPNGQPDSLDPVPRFLRVAGGNPADELPALFNTGFDNELRATDHLIQYLSLLCFLRHLKNPHMYHSLILLSGYIYPKYSSSI